MFSGPSYYLQREKETKDKKMNDKYQTQNIRIEQAHLKRRFLVVSSLFERSILD